MYSEEDLASAVAAGVLSEEAAAAFRQHVSKLRSARVIDEEHVRLVTGFNDVFVVIACALLLVALHWIGATVSAWLGDGMLAIAAWLLAEFFTRRRHMALPAIVLLLAFVGGVFAAGVAALGSFVAASALAAGAAWLHWLRFHVPITVAAGAAAVVGCLVALSEMSPEARTWTSGVLLVSGIAVFIVAMYWDGLDPVRQTRKSDVAFWLHLLAAPLLVHPVFATLGLLTGNASIGKAAAVAVLYVLLALVSLAIDRRALMVSALAYVLYAFTALLKQYGVVSLSFATTALAIGSALLLLSAFWHRSRALVLGLLPSAVLGRLAPLRVS